MNAKDEVSFNEGMRLCLTYFFVSLREAAMPADKQFAAFDELPSAAWELRQDLLNVEPVVNWSRLPNEIRKEIEGLVTQLKEMSGSAYEGHGLPDFQDISWEGIRGAAASFLERYDQWWRDNKSNPNY